MEVNAMKAKMMRTCLNTCWVTWPMTNIRMKFWRMMRGYSRKFRKGYDSYKKKPVLRQ